MSDSIQFDTSESAFATMIAVTDAAEQHIWRDLIDGMPKSAQERTRFVREIVQPLASDLRNSVAIYLGPWTQRHLALYETALQYQIIKTTPVPSGGVVTRTEQYVEIAYYPRKVAKGLRAEMRCQLAAECLFFQAKLFLDYIAHTFAFYFGFDIRGEGSAHTNLTLRFKKEWARITRHRVPADLERLMRELDHNVIKFRNRYIEHVATPDTGLRSGLAYTGEETATSLTTPRIYLPQRVRVVAPNRVKVSVPPIWEPQTLISRMETYLEAVIVFFALSVDVSIIGNDVPPPDSRVIPKVKTTRATRGRLRLSPQAAERAAALAGSLSEG